MTSNYVGLNNVTMYSAQRSLLTIDNIVDSAARAGQKAVAITDINNLHGTYQFIKACSKANIRPIIGANILVNNNLNEKNRDNSPIILLAKNALGYANICKLITKAHIDGFYYVPRISYDWLEEHSDDLICISGPYGPISSAITKFESEELANFYYQKLKNIFQDNLFVATAPAGHYYEGEKAGRLTNQFIESKYDNIVIVNNSRILNKTDSDYFNMMTSLRVKKPYDPSHNERYNQLYIKSDAELKREFDYFDSACNTINHIVEQCNFQFDTSYKFPHTGISNPSDHINQLITDGLRRNEHKLVQDKSIYLDRISDELDVIKSNGFLDYFIIVQDIVRFARENNIYVGPGRGSVGGSLVAYCLDIHDFDPIKHGLYFERFLNKDRVSMPDIDLDFEHLRREEVIQYIYTKYGHDKTANIGNIMTLGLRMAIKDVAKSLGVPFEDANQMTSLVPKQAEAFEDCKKDQRFMQEYNENITLRNIMKYVSIIGGSMRGTSTHAAGVVVAPSSITDYTPLQLDKKTGKTITQFDMTAIDGIGLIKLDLLGLKTMSIIHNAVDYIKTKYNKDIDVRNLNLNNKQTYKTIADGHTSAIFQLESQGITDMAKKLKISKFEEIRDLVALYRPGALDSKQDKIYIKNKLGSEYRPIHPSLGEILKDTKGILLFQESYMDAAVKLAGFSPSEADLLRKSIGKKQKDLLAQSKAQWISGCEKKGISRKDAEKIFEAFEAASRYSFNRSHSVAYGYLSYVTAALKTFYPLEFMTSHLQIEYKETDKFDRYRKECRRLGFDIEAPSINKSDSNFIMDYDNNSIIYGLSAIKGVGEIAAQNIVGQRTKPYKSFTDFMRRINHNVVNKKVLISLIQSGCFDCLQEYNRETLIHNLQDVVSFYKHMDFSKVLIIPEPKLKPIRTTSMYNVYAMEKELMGISF